MFFDYREKIGRFITKNVKNIFSVDLEKVVVTSPPQVKFGEYSSTFPFQLAKILKRSPLQIGEEFVNGIDLSQSEISNFVIKVENIKGYVNFHLKRSIFFRELLNTLLADNKKISGPWDTSLKVIVEHTNINPNKAAHVGHLRNAILGDTLVRLLKKMGFNVEVQNYIDNTGVQVADIVVGLKYLKGMGVKEVKELSQMEKFDYFCWDLYTEVGKFYEKKKENLELRRNTLREIESGKGELYEISEMVSSSIVRCHLKTMKRLGIGYDLLPRESDILHLKFWERAFNLLREKRTIEYENEGENRGCWVFKYLNRGKEDTKIIVRSNGTVTYTGKDIAYQMWKFGKLGVDFYYKKFSTEDGFVWMTTSHKDEGEREHPTFGNGDIVFNVIDVRQGYTQNIVYEALKKLGYKREYENSVHFSYEMVALSPKCAVDLGFKLSEEDKGKNFVEVSGRKGLGVKADDLIDKLLERALEEVKNRDVKPDEMRDTAIKIAVGALRYYMLKYTKNSMIIFDMEDALSFEGETGPYLQYSVVRAKNILRKYMDEYQLDEEDLYDIFRKSVFSEISMEDDIWELLWEFIRLDEMVYNSYKKREISILAKGLFSISQKFSAFYSKYRILKRENKREREELLSFVYIFLKIMEFYLWILGIPIVDRM